MGRNKTAVGARDARPDLATGYDQKISEARGILKDLNVAIREARTELANVNVGIGKAREEAMTIAMSFADSLHDSSHVALTEWKGMFSELGGKMLDKAIDEMIYETHQCAADERRRLVEQFSSWVDKLIRAIAFGLDGKAVQNDPDMSTEEVKAWTTILAAGAGKKTPGLPQDAMEGGEEWAQEFRTNVFPALLRELEAIKNTSSDTETVQVPPQAYPILFEMFDKETGALMQRATVSKAGQRVKVKEHKGRNVIVRMTLKDGRVLERED